MIDERETTPLRVCYFGTYRASYSRNQILLNGLREVGVTVFECHQPLWQGVEDRVQQASGGWRKPGFWLRVLRVYWRLFRSHGRTPAYDVMLIGYPGQFDTFLGRLLSWWRRKPMVLDHYMSLYLIAPERGLVARSPMSGRLIRLLEGAGLRLPDLIISDTPEYVDYHCHTYKLNPSRFTLVPAGADDRFFYPRPELAPPADKFRVIYYGTFIPNHGVPTMIQAMALLKDQAHIQFDLYGEGPDAQQAMETAAELGLENVHFHGWIDKASLPLEMAQSHLILGAFGMTKQSHITVQNKIWEAAAMSRPTVSGDAPTVRNTFVDRKEIYLVERDNPQALAEAILALSQDSRLCQELAAGAYRRFQAGHSLEGLGRTLRQALMKPNSKRYAQNQPDTH